MTILQSRTEYPTDAKIPVWLGAKLDQALHAYAAAATSAGVAILALTCPADARIIYTRANEQIFPNKLFPLDLNHGTKKDFTFVDSHASTSFGGGWGVLTIFPNRSTGEPPQVTEPGGVLAAGDDAHRPDHLVQAAERARTVLPGHQARPTSEPRAIEGHAAHGYVRPAPERSTRQLPRSRPVPVPPPPPPRRPPTHARQAPRHEAARKLQPPGRPPHYPSGIDMAPKLTLGGGPCLQ